MPQRPIRVLRVITWLPVGGIERKLVEVLPRLDRARFEVSVACIRERGPLAKELEAAGIRVELIPFRTRMDLAGLRALARLMREREIDIVHSHMYRSNAPAAIAARMAGVTCVWGQVHNVGTWETRRQLWLDRALCRWRRGVIAVSEQVRRDVMANLRLPEARVPVIYNGVDLARFGTGAGREELRREQGAGEGTAVFILAARLVEQKRPQDFLAMAERLVRERAGGAALPDMQFWVLGDGAMSEELKRQAENSPARGAIRFFGRRDDVARFLAAADVFVMPSTKEGFSNALMEAMASGLAILATEVGGNAEAARGGKEGIILPPRDAEALFQAARRMAAEPGARAALGAAAKLRAREFSLEAMVRNVEGLYESSLRNG